MLFRLKPKLSRCMNICQIVPIPNFQQRIRSFAEWKERARKEKEQYYIEQPLYVICIPVKKWQTIFGIEQTVSGLCMQT